MAVKTKTTFNPPVEEGVGMNFEKALEVPGVYLDEEDDYLIVLGKDPDGIPVAIANLTGNEFMRVDPECDDWLWNGLTRLPIQSVTFTFEEE